MKIQKADNPERYLYSDSKYDYLCQIESNEYSMSIIKSKHSKKASGKAKTLYKGNTDDFCYLYDGKIEHGGLDIEMAFKNFIKNNII